MKKRLRIGVAAAVVAGAVGVGLAAAHSSPDARGQADPNPVAAGKYTLKATLRARSEVPRPKGASGSGTFTGTLTIVRAPKGTISWRLRFSGLTGRATAAHIHVGKVGKSGPVVVPLCGPCVSGVHKASSAASATATRAIINGTAYVNVHTQANPGGEIRGQITAKSIGNKGGGANANPYGNMTVPQTAANIARGKALSAKYSCEGCHTLNGAKSTGPTWKGLAGSRVHLTTGKTVVATDGYLIWSIEQPDAQIVSGYSSGIMTTAIGNIPLAEARAMTAYIKSVK